jgi:hypothetical protein
MNTLWIAFGIYIVGIAVILFIRPAMMFREGNGTWKEFGLSNKDTYTVFPFWLFTLIWAILSYVFATMINVFFAGLALQSMPSLHTATASPAAPAAPASPTSPSILTPISQAPELPANVVGAPGEVPGYYVLDTPTKGPPKYVYFGTKPPALTNLSANA